MGTLVLLGSKILGGGIMTVHVDRMLETKTEHNIDEEALPKQTLKRPRWADSFL
jgi:hypothetical protein